ncbi:MAG TPA: BrnA antitoxin family protein [Burkholderiales bacterium]|nr:BrnA antitoxin family protein [Burkholderiales bacterium]
MSKTSRITKIKLPTVAEDRKIRAAAKADPDAQPLTTKQLKAMVPLKSLRGRPRSDSPKQLVSIRYSRDVVEYFKATGDGWQSRMDGVLLAYVNRRSRNVQD